MKKLFAVYLESLDQNLQVFLDESEAKAAYDALAAEGKSVKMEEFADYMLSGFSKENGCNASDPNFWEEMVYDNGHCKLVETFCWHQEPQEEGYYPDYRIMW